MSKIKLNSWIWAILVNPIWLYTAPKLNNITAFSRWMFCCTAFASAWMRRTRWTWRCWRGSYRERSRSESRRGRGLWSNFGGGRDEWWESGRACAPNRCGTALGFGDFPRGFELCTQSNWMWCSCGEAGRAQRKWFSSCRLQAWCWKTMRTKPMVRPWRWYFEKKNKTKKVSQFETVILSFCFCFCVFRLVFF